MNIGKAIEYYRTKQGLTTIELSEKTGLSQSSISHYENGRRNPSDDAIKTIAKALGTTPDELVKKAESYAGDSQKIDTYTLKQREERFKRSFDIALSVSDTVMLGINLHIRDLLADRIPHRAMRRNSATTLESLLEKVVFQVLDENRDIIEQRILDELNDLETSIEDILRNLYR